MAQYIYAIIPYDIGIKITPEDKEQGIYAPYLPELKNIDSEFADESLYCLFENFIEINTCYRQSAFTNNKDGYNWIRAEICQIAKALGANELWYVAEICTDAMHSKDFSFDEWKESLHNEKKQYLIELSTEVLKGNSIYSYYHDDFSDVIIEKPPKQKYPRIRRNG